MSIESAKTDLLIEGLSDMHHLSWIISTVARETGIPRNEQDKILQPVLDVICDLLVEEWAIAGQVVEGPEGILEVRSWNLPAEKVTERIRDEWLGLDEPPEAGEVAWLELTEKGRARARRFQCVRDELVSKGLDDRLDLSQAIGVVARCFDIPEQGVDELMEPTLYVISMLPDGGLAAAGSVAKGSDGPPEFSAWGLSLNETVERIKRDWLALGRPPTSGEVVCLELTDEGRAYAQSLIDTQESD